MFGVLEIILGGHTVVAGMGVTRELEISFRHVLRAAADLDVGTVGFDTNARAGRARVGCWLMRCENG